MSKKLYLSTLETLPEGVKITRIFGIVSAAGCYLGYNEKSFSDRELVKRCANEFPKANAILGITHSEFGETPTSRSYSLQGTAVEISGHDPDADFICAK